MDLVLAYWPWVIASVNLVVAVLASAHVLLHKRDNHAAIGWVGVIWLTPLSAPSSIILLGINRVRRRARRPARQQGPLKQTRAAAEIPGVVRPGLRCGHMPLGPAGRLVARDRAGTLPGNQSSAVAQRGRSLPRHGRGDPRSQAIGFPRAVTSSPTTRLAAIHGGPRQGRQPRRGRAVMLDDIGVHYSWSRSWGPLRAAGVPFACSCPRCCPGTCTTRTCAATASAWSWTAGSASPAA